MGEELPAHLSDVVDKLHIITGPNGMCMCGTDGLNCLQILSRVSTDIRDADYVLSHGFTNMKREYVPTYPPPVGVLR